MKYKIGIFDESVAVRTTHFDLSIKQKDKLIFKKYDHKSFRHVRICFCACVWVYRVYVYLYICVRVCVGLCVYKFFFISLASYLHLCGVDHNVSTDMFSSLTQGLMNLNCVHESNGMDNNGFCVFFIKLKCSKGRVRKIR